VKSSPATYLIYVQIFPISTLFSNTLSLCTYLNVSKFHAHIKQNVKLKSCWF
jgi:hypothetical protein